MINILTHSFRFLYRCECLHNIVPTVVCGERIENTSGSVVGVGAFCSQCRRRCCEWYEWSCTWITRFMSKWTPNGSKSCSQYGGGIDRKSIKWMTWRRQSRPWLAAWHGQGRQCQRGFLNHFTSFTKLAISDHKNQDFLISPFSKNDCYSSTSIWV